MPQGRTCVSNFYFVSDGQNGPYCGLIVLPYHNVQLHNTLAKQMTHPRELQVRTPSFSSQLIQKNNFDTPFQLKRDFSPQRKPKKRQRRMLKVP